MKSYLFPLFVILIIFNLSCGEDHSNMKNEGETYDSDSMLSEEIRENKDHSDYVADDEAKDLTENDVPDITDANVDHGEEKDADNEQADEEEEEEEEKCPYENFPNYNNGDCWSDYTANPMEQYNAKRYCEELGGRLPTISELRTLIKNCPATEFGGSCGVTDSCSATSCWDETCDGCMAVRSVEDRKYTRRIWSSTVLSDRTDLAWYVYFHDNSVDAIYTFSFYNVRCIKQKPKKYSHFLP